MNEELSFTRLLSFLEELERAKIFYRLEHIRDSVMIAATVPGERWGVEFFADGHVEVERFVSDGTIESEERLKDLIEYGS